MITEPTPSSGCLHPPCSPLDAQRAALSEARQRIIARYEHVELWLKQPAATEAMLANWSGMVEGLRQARQIIGAMWDNLPVPIAPKVEANRAAALIWILCDGLAAIVAASRN